MPINPKRYGLIAGCFDPFPHPGHLAAMDQAVREMGLDGVVVCLHTDPSIERPHKPKPCMTIVERMIMLRALQWTVQIEPYDTEADLLWLLKTVKYEVRILGDDYRDADYTGDELKKEVYFADRYAGWSATEFRKLLGVSGLQASFKTSQ